MEIDKKALAVTRLVSVIYNWDPNLGGRQKNIREREKVLKKLLKEALPNPDSQKRAVNMVLAMTLLTSGHVATVRSPEVYSEKKSGTWATITSDPAQVFLKALGFQTYRKITRQDYENAKKLLPVIGSSSMLESEVRAVFQSTQVSKEYPKITSVTMDGDKFGDLGVGGYEYLHRGLSNMSEAAIIRVTDIGSAWDSTRGVSTSYDQRSAAGFADTPNSILFSFKNPKRRGFNALELSKYRSEKEVILSGVSKVNDYRLSFTAKNSRKDYNRYSHYLQVEVTPNMIFIREGLKPKYMEENLSPEEVHEFVKKALTFEEIEITARDGDVIKLNAFKDTCKIICTGEIL